MKLIRWGLKGAEKPGLVDRAGILRDLSGQVGDITPDLLSPDGLKRLSRIDAASLPKVPDGARLGVPFTGISKIVCVGLNYADHAAETGAKIPKEPILFLKAVSSLNGPNDDIVIPRGSVKTDWEVELGVVIGTRAPMSMSMTRWIMSRAIARSTMSRSANIRASGVGNGTRARAATALHRSDPGW